MIIGGWGGWAYAIGSSMTLKNAMGESLTTFCLLDRDYHSEEEVAARLDEANRRGVRLHIWARKELENYLLHAKAIRRLIVERVKGKSAPSEAEVQAAILRCCDAERQTVEDAWATTIMKADKKYDAAGANRAARKYVQQRWQDIDQRISMVSGKAVLGEVSRWATENYNVSFGPTPVARKLTRAEIPKEVAMFLEAVELNSPLPPVVENSADSGDPAG
jgi:hypothetical protein